jgi:parvulin-like peptidyl-prolyl isomerase
MLLTIARIRRTQRHDIGTTAALLPWCFLIVFAAGAAAVLAPLKAWAAEPEIVARVNGEAVTRAEFQRMRANPLTLRQLQQDLGVQDPDAKELDRLALQKLIWRRLMIQEASLKHITVTEKELDAGIAALRRQFEDLRRFGEWMTEQGLNDKSLVESVRTDMLVDRVRASLVEGVRVTGEQVQQYYETHKEELKTSEVRLQIIVVKDKAAAQEVSTALRSGKNFASLARERSIGRRAANGGDTGWVASETLWPPLRKLVSTLKAGDVGGPLQKGDELYIVRLQDRRVGSMKTLAEARPQIEPYLLAVKREEVIQAWLTEKEKRAKIEVLLVPG